MAPKPRAKKRVTQPWNPNEGPDPVWLAQINETWHHGESVVRLPHTDFRKPSLWPGQEQEREQEQERRQGQWLQQQEQLLDDTSANEAGFATQATQCLNLNLNLLTPLAHSSSLAPSNSTSTSPAPSSLPIQTPPQNQLHFEPRSQSYSQSYCESQSILSPGSNVNHRNHGSYIPNPHVRYASTLHRWPFTRGTRGRGDPRNAGMKETQARFRTEQARRKIERPDFVGHFNAGASAKSSFNSSGADQSYQTPIIVPTLEVDMAVRTPSQPPVYHCLPPKPSQHRPQSNANMNGLYNSSSSFGRANTSSSRPSLQKYPLQPSLLYQQNGAVARRPDDWTTWNELRIKVYGLSPNVSTRDLWKAFSKEGSIAAIEIFEDSNGNREGKATIRFSPPPPRAFWQVDRYPVFIEGAEVTLARLELDPKPKFSLIESPTDPQKKYPQVMTMKPDSLSFGFMYNETTMMSMYKVIPKPQAEIVFRQDIYRREIVVEFTIRIRNPQMSEGNTSKNADILHSGRFDRTETIRFSIPFSQLQAIQRVQSGENKMGLVISLETPPRFFRKLDELMTHEKDGRYWNQNDAWYRQTDIVYDPTRLRSSELTLIKSDPILDIGRWTTYHFIFDMLKNSRAQFETMSEAFRDHNVQIMDFPDFTLIPRSKPAVWDFIDESTTKQKRSSSGIDEMMIEYTVPVLAFPVRYQLEVCISQGYMNEHNMTKDFMNKLIEMDQKKAQDLLECIANQKKRVYDPMKIFEMNVVGGTASRPKIPYYCAYARSATITPSTIYYNTPTVETSNRVIRQYSEHADRFLRVRFTDEKFEGKINPTMKETMNEVFTRIKRAMVNGIKIGDRRYMFLAFGNSQFREHGAYFFAPLPYLFPKGIRSWMGLFKEIKVVAKFAARLGQCFSTTRAISGSKVTLVEIEDVNRNGYCFTDGVGKISPFLAQLAASELGIPQTAAGAPSVFQFRLGGCKGVLAISPDVKSREIHIRHSQYKFAATHEGLEIIRCSQFIGASLNRQLILVLSTLGVPDYVFEGKLKLQLANLELAMKDEKMALSLLQKDIDANQMTLSVAGMILEGFQRVREPFVISLLQLWRAWSIKYLKEKARIPINDGALLLGCTDETGQLKGHFNTVPGPEDHSSTTSKEKQLPEIFVQVSKGLEDKPRVVKGPMLLARNPSLHPGDIRVVRGVDIPELHHLQNVVVFPQTGDRDIASMCSGGDLDGDDFLVIWDKELLAHEWNHEPMNYDPPKPVELDRAITTNDITSFFVTYMKNDNLPTIAHAHVAHADNAEDGVKDEKCLKLAALHSMAVDYVKSGEPAHMPRELAPRRWPHFMEKTHKPKSQTYISRKILGKLYDQVERVDFVPSFSAPFDDRILDAYNLQINTLEDAMILKREYDAAINRIMAQHEIRTEFEVWSTFVLHHSNQSKDYKFHEIIGELSAALKDQFREACYKKAGGKDFDHIGPFVAAMYRVTFEEITQALEECRQVKMVGGVETPLRKMIPASMPLMSFPWLFQDILGKIANGTWSGETVSTTHPVQASTRRAQAKKNRTKPEMPVEEDVLETAEGFTHRGEVLGLFEDNLIDYEPDVPDIVPDAKPNSNSSKRESKVPGFSVDDMLFGVSSLDIGPHENQASVTEVQPRSSLENLFDAPLGAERVSSPIEPGSNRLASEIQVSSSESTSAITPSSSRLNFHERQYEYKENPAQVNALGNPLKEVRSTQTKAEVLPMISSSRSSSQPQTNLQSETNMDCEEAMSDFEPEEEIVHLDTKSSLLDQLAEFD